MCESISVVNIAKNLVQHKCTMHIDVRHHFLRDNAKKGFIKMVFCKSKDQVVNIFIKALSRKHFEQNRLYLGLIRDF